ncbi:MAG: DMT family transporter [Desulfobacula sp.]|jgi:bacterial/archaeal transporter family-2 protein|uniref:DMT family transporter n=1 Tax=Desulfobacula sp. TaxID=2593537 RepID=UPI001D223549|nr:DMT family transporter [Desulfobacula sp.]MBT3805242.1 DMT family transporter [Desulfobacula sp.]MBT4026991.1 DMT family transporter [Desulfobacula sp.]MBT4201414.1 DMT family transporter [Desulfobacula sp.]MBT5547331.1 DMT family transporter [Desulfobacula sp.]
MKIILLFIALAAGMMAPLQAGLNGKMGRAIGDPVYAALISFFVGTLGLFCYALVTRVEFTSIRHASNIHWTVWSAGLLGAFYVTSVIILAPKIGATLTFSFIVAGQLAMAVFLDHFGLLGVPVQAFGWQRLLGILLITAGAILIKKY